MTLDVRPLRPADVADALDDIAALRIAVFRDWPYLYDGDLAYERRYLAPLVTAQDAIVVGAFDGGRLVGASTGMPLAFHSDDFSAAFAGADMDIGDIFYCAESVLLPDYRGQGAGHQFFDWRESFARDRGYAYCAFCTVQRPADHPSRPAAYRPLDTFWRRRGFETLPGVVAYFNWKDIGAEGETAKPLQFWARALKD